MVGAEDWGIGRVEDWGSRGKDWGSRGKDKVEDGRKA